MTPLARLLLISAVAAAVVRGLLDSRLGNSGLLYIAVPFTITMVLLLADPGEATHWTVRYWRGFRRTFGVLFGVSIVLYEGIVCVLMFLPIYLIVALFAMLSEGLSRWWTNRGGGTAVALSLPLVAVFASLEGTHETLSFDRYNEVSVSRLVARPAATLRANIELPFELRSDRDWFLSIFPMPAPADTREVREGAVHEIEYTYHRWLFTNTHRGHMRLEMTEVEADHIVTTVLEDTSYISHYLNLLGTRIDLEPIGTDATEVTLTVRFERKLDPAWYFGPLERFGVSRMAEHLIDEVIAR